MRFVVGLWSVKVSHGTFSSVELNDRITALDKAVEVFDADVKKLTFPPGQTVRGIFIAPEYFLANKYADFFDNTSDHRKIIERTITAQDRDGAVERMRGISEKYPDILLIPGTIAWKKTFTRRTEENFRRDPVTLQRTNVPKLNQPDRRLRAVNELNYFINIDDSYSRVRNPFILSKERTIPNLSKGTSTLTMTRPSHLAKRDMALGQKTIKDLDRSGKESEKNLKSPIEYYMRNTSFVYADGKILYKYHKRGDYFESVNSEDMVFIPSSKSPVKTIDVSLADQVTCGFEICLDHNMEMLKTLVAKDGLGDIDLHILCSASVKNVTANMCMRDGGFLLHASSSHADTAVYQNDRGRKTPLTPERSGSIGNQPFDTYIIALLSPTDAKLLRDARAAVAQYDEERTIFGSSESKNALAKLQRIIATRDMTALRAHLGWYLGKAQAVQPHGAGAKIPTGKRFHALLSTLTY